MHIEKTLMKLTGIVKTNYKYKLTIKGNVYMHTYMLTLNPPIISKRCSWKND